MTGTFPALPKELSTTSDLRSWTIQVLDRLIDATSAGACPAQPLPPPTKAAPPTWEHLHHQPELFVQCGGATRFSFPESPRQLDLRAGQVLVMPRLLAHREKVLGGDAFHNLVFMPNDRQLAYHIAKRDPHDRSWPLGSVSEHIATAEGSLVNAAMDGLTRCARSHDVDQRQLSAWFMAWATLTRDILSTAPTEEVADDRVAHCRQWVESYLSKPELTVELLANRCGCSADHLGRIFRAGTGETLAAYIVRERMNRACSLMAGSELSIRTVANAVGYRDASYFSRSFRRVIGQTPDAWRQRRQAGSGLR